MKKLLHELFEITVAVAVRLSNMKSVNQADEHFYAKKPTDKVSISFYLSVCYVRL